jgi:putative hydrolase of the HAD superfamily
MIEQNVIVFDLDDTLVCEFDYLKSAYREIATVVDQFNHFQLFDEMMNWRDSGENVFQKLINVYPNFLLTDLIDIYRKHEPILLPYRGAVSLLNNLKHNGNILGIITDGRSITQRNKLKAAGLIELFDRIVISEEFGSEKPNDSNFTNFHELNGDKYIYIGDNPRKDFVSPNNLGWLTVGVLDSGTNIHKQNMDLTISHQPKYWVKDFMELENLLKLLL